MENTKYNKTLLMLRGSGFWDKHEDLFNETIALVHKRKCAPLPSEHMHIMELTICHAIDQLSYKPKLLNCHTVYGYSQGLLKTLFL